MEYKYAAQTLRNMLGHEIPRATICIVQNAKTKTKGNDYMILLHKIRRDNCSLGQTVDASSLSEIRRQILTFLWTDWEN